MADTTETLARGALVQHGKDSDRIYLIKRGNSAPTELLDDIEKLAEKNSYSKIFAKVGREEFSVFAEAGYNLEAFVPNFYRGEADMFAMCRYPNVRRAAEPNAKELESILKLAKSKGSQPMREKKCGAQIRKCSIDDAPKMAEVYREVFESYPFPIFDPDYIAETMKTHIAYFCAEIDGEIAAIASAECDFESLNAEMTDFATLPDKRGRALASEILEQLEAHCSEIGIRTFYTIARAANAGINITFARAGYCFGGRLKNNTAISGNIESMNVWHKPAPKQCS